MDRFDTLIRSLTIAASRRNVLTAVAVGVLAAHLDALGVEHADAKKHRRHRKHRKNNGGKNKQAQTPPPAPPSAPPVPPPPSGTVRPDATCPLQGNLFFLTGGQARLAQTFTALASGPLVSAQLDLIHSATTTNDYVLRLSPVDGAGVPTNDVLAATTVTADSVPGGTSSVPFTFPTPFAVVAGTTYALVLARPGQDNFAWSRRPGDGCLGQGFDSENETAPFEILPGGFDLTFTTFVSS